jgi:PLP dependent protein
MSESPLTESMLTPEDAQAIRARLDEVTSRASAAAQRSGRSADSVSILLATKMQSVEKIRVALEHGFTLIGENRVQELTGKAEALADIPHETHLIGPLQKNKVNHTLRVASCIQSIDNVPLAEKIQRRLEAEDQIVEYFVQVNTSREDTKFGIAPEEVSEFVGSLRGFDRMKMRGFMTIGLPGQSDEEIRPSYQELVAVKDRCLEQGLIDESMCELSMGMSSDYELAIEEGATMVRIGSSVFGARPPQ